MLWDSGHDFDSHGQISVFYSEVMFWLLKHGSGSGLFSMPITIEIMIESTNQEEKMTHYCASHVMLMIVILVKHVAPISLWSSMTEMKID